MIRMATMLATLIIGLMAGPAVSLYGSPTVSPGTDASWAEERLPSHSPSSLSSLAAVLAVLDQLLGVVPCATAGGHRDGYEEAHDDHADEQPAQRLEGQES